MKVRCSVLSDTDLANVRKEIVQIQRLVQTAAGALAVRIRTKAPRKSGDLISGIIPSPWEENSKYPGKIVRQVYMDAGMNDTFVKMSKSGKRYYYPASQEFGFQIANHTTIPARAAAANRRTRVPGKFFMNDTFIDYIPVFEQAAEALVDKVVSK
jgi:hypothetical protein